MAARVVMPVRSFGHAQTETVPSDGPEDAAAGSGQAKPGGSGPGGRVVDAEYREAKR